MPDRYLVRCTAAAGRAMAGIYSAGLTSNGMIATWKQERATCFDTKVAASDVATRLARRFSGTTWEACHVA